jgi:hypothetical protein
MDLLYAFSVALYPVLFARDPTSDIDPAAATTAPHLQDAPAPRHDPAAATTPLQAEQRAIVLSHRPTTRRRNNPALGANILSSPVTTLPTISNCHTFVVHFVVLRRFFKKLLQKTWVRVVIFKRLSIRTICNLDTIPLLG